MARIFVLLAFLFACATGRHHALSPAHQTMRGMADLEATNQRAQRVIAAKDKTIQTLLGRLSAAHAAVDPESANDPYAEFSDGAHTPSLEGYGDESGFSKVRCSFKGANPFARKTPPVQTDTSNEGTIVKKFNPADNPVKNDNFQMSQVGSE